MKGIRLVRASLRGIEVLKSKGAGAETERKRETEREKASKKERTSKSNIPSLQHMVRAREQQEDRLAKV
jgi:hypothetical protein